MSDGSRRLRAARTVKAFRKEGLLFPSRLRNSQTTVFRPLTASTAIRVLNNPRYAGAYVYGRRRYRRAIDGNGAERDHAALAIGSNGAAYDAVERAERQYASLVFMPEIRDRGWPQAGPNWKVLETSAAAQTRLRELVRQVMSISPTFDALEASMVSSAIRDSLLAAADAAFAHTVDVGISRELRWAFQDISRHPDILVR